MHAITARQTGGPDVLVWSEVPTPHPGPHEVLIATTAAGVNRADLLQRQGHYPPPPGVSEIIGLEVSGRIEAIGSEVTGWSPGDECVALLAGGGYAEYVTVDEGQVTAPPPGVDLVTAGAVMEVAATVVSNLDHAQLQAGETFLVHGGSGGIGSFAIQYAHALGARVITTAGAPERLEYCRLLGADLAVDYHDDWVAAVQDATDGRGVDVILDNMGAKYLDLNVTALAEDGRIMTIGLQGGVKGTLNIAKLLNKRGSFTAMSLRSRPIAQKAAIVGRVAEVVWPMFADRQISLSSLTRIPMQEAARAHELLEAGGSTGKIVLTLT